MFRSLTRSVLAAAAMAAVTSTSMAIPTLQLGILGGTYNVTNESSISTGDTFKLYAFLTPGNGANVNVASLLADTYYISAALTPKTGPTNSSLGSFSFAGNTVNATTGMTYGSPPLEVIATQLGDPGDLADHGIYETFFRQFSFQFSSANQFNPLDVGTVPNASLSNLTAGTGMYYSTFDVDVSLLNSLNEVHFDLYNSAVVACGNSNNCVAGDIDINDFAPFSHDAQSGSSSSTSSSSESSSGGDIPEPGTNGLALLGLGLVGASFAMRRKARRA